MFTVQTAPPLPPLNGAPPRDRAIVATLLYFDLFSFPLRADELIRYAHQHLGHDLPGTGEWWDSHRTPHSPQPYHYLKGRASSVPRRAELTTVSTAKLARANKYARLLQLLPGVRFVGIIGSLAMASAVPEDDIDFLIIARK